MNAQETVMQSAITMSVATYFPSGPVFRKTLSLIRRDKLSNLKTAVFQPSLPGPGSGYKNTCLFRENHDRSDIALSSGNTFLLTDLNGAVYNQSPGIFAGRIRHTRMADGHG